MGDKKKTVVETKESKQPLVAGRRRLYVPPKVMRPFAGMKDEAKLVAMRELIPAASLKLKTTEEYGGKEFLLVTLAPEMAQGVVLTDGTIMVSMQSSSRSNDPAHDLGLILEKLIDAKPGTVLRGVDIRQRAPRLPEMIDPEMAGEFAIHEDLGFWVSSDQEQSEQLTEAIAETREGLVPTKAIPGIEDAFWCEMDGEEFIRWILPYDDREVYNALARLRAEGRLDWDSNEFQGAFRGLGVIAPVWKIVPKVGAEGIDELGQRMSSFVPVFLDALNSEEILTPRARQMRAGIVSREVALS